MIIIYRWLILIITVFLTFTNTVHATNVDTLKIVFSRNGAWLHLTKLPEACKKYGLNIETQDVDPKITVSSLLVILDRKDADIVGSAITTTLIADSNKANIEIFANVARGGASLIATKDIKSIKDLKGKKVGTMRNTGVEMVFLIELEKNNLSYTGISDNPDVELVSVNYSNSLQALDQKLIDAVVQPFPETEFVLKDEKYHEVKSFTSNYRPILIRKDMPKSLKDRLTLCYKDMIDSVEKDKDRKVIDMVNNVVSMNSPRAFSINPIIDNKDLNELVDFLKKYNKISKDYKISPDLNNTDRFKK